MDVNSWRKHPYYSFDPFAAEIEPALLNSHDIRKYVDRGCLIDETDFHPSRLKTATYELRLERMFANFAYVVRLLYLLVHLRSFWLSLR